MSRRKGTLCRGEVSHDGVGLSSLEELSAAAVFVRVAREAIAAQWIVFVWPGSARAAATLMTSRREKTRRRHTEFRLRKETSGHSRYGDIPS